MKKLLALTLSILMIIAVIPALVFVAPSAVTVVDNAQESIALTKEVSPVLASEENCFTSHQMKIGCKKMHVLRHTCATAMLNADVNIKVIQSRLGHSDISTTVNIKYPHKFKVTVKAA